MKLISKPRQPVCLSDPLRRKVEMYALAAAATGLGMATVSVPAAGEVVFTPAHGQIPFREGITLDLNHDGIPDFRLHRVVLARADSIGMLASSLHGNRVLSTGGSRGHVSALPAGSPIGPDSPKFTAGGTYSSIWGPAKLLYNCVEFSGPPSCFGPWDKTQNAYIGFQFSIHGEMHYGWARLNVVVQSAGVFNVYLTGYAYETVPNKPIVAGKTSGPDESSAEESETSANPARPFATLGMLSVGNSVLPLWRQ